MVLDNIIDFSKIDCPDEFHRIIECSKSFGFFYLKNHAIDIDKIRRFFESSKIFFNSQDELKKQYLAIKEDSYLGYRPIGFEVSRMSGEVERCEQYKFGYKYSNNKSMLDQRYFSATPFNTSEVNYIWFQMHEISKSLMRVFSRDMNDCFFEKNMSNPLHQIGVNFYKGSKEKMTLMSEHTDMSIFTLLLDNNSGLQGNIYDRYIDVATDDNNLLLVMIGEYLGKHSQGKYKIFEHKVVASINDRLSMNYKYRPNFDTLIPGCFEKKELFKSGELHKLKLDNILTS